MPSVTPRPTIVIRGVGGIPLILPLLHGASGFWDEIFIFGGIGVILLGLAFLSWRSGRTRKRRGARRRR
jgi:hypothetical protein